MNFYQQRDMKQREFMAHGFSDANALSMAHRYACAPSAYMERVNAYRDEIDGLCRHLYDNGWEYLPHLLSLEAWMSSTIFIGDKAYKHPGRNIRLSPFKYIDSTEGQCMYECGGGREIAHACRLLANAHGGLMFVEAHPVYGLVIGGVDAFSVITEEENFILKSAGLRWMDHLMFSDRLAETDHAMDALKVLREDADATK